MGHFLWHSPRIRQSPTIAFIASSSKRADLNQVGTTILELPIILFLLFNKKPEDQPLPLPALFILSHFLPLTLKISNTPTAPLVILASMEGDDHLPSGDLQHFSLFFFFVKASLSVFCLFYYR